MVLELPGALPDRIYFETFVRGSEGRIYIVIHERRHGVSERVKDLREELLLADKELLNTGSFSGFFKAGGTIFINYR
jgi:hypothetical protein